MKKHVRLIDVCHWQLKRCVVGSLCQACSEPETMSDTVSQVDRPSPVDSDGHRQSLGHRPLTYVAGVDISFVKNDRLNACAACVVTRLPEFDVRSFTFLFSYCHYYCPW